MFCYVLLPCMWIAADFLRRRAGCFGGRGSACLLHVEKTCVPRAKFGADARCQTQLSLNSFFSLQSPPPPPPVHTRTRKLYTNSIQTQRSSLLPPGRAQQAVVDRTRIFYTKEVQPYFSRVLDRFRSDPGSSGPSGEDAPPPPPSLAR